MLGAAGLLATLLLVSSYRRYALKDAHFPQANGDGRRLDHPVSDRDPVRSSWQGTCRKHGLSACDRARRVYDLVLFSTELDWLEIRLHAHAPYVDYFVVVESPTTFTKLSKPLVLQQNWDRFADFHHKIIYKLWRIRSLAHVVGIMKIYFRVLC